MVKKERKIYTVSQVNTLIKVVLENNLPGRFVIRGELSGWKSFSSGHYYPSLKDEGGILPCAMWRSSINKLKFEPEDGMEVFATGNIDVYVPRGEYKFIIDKLEPAGVGALQLAFEQMVRRLEAEGLFKEEHKVEIPAYPMRIGILTSETGAAVRDIEDSILSRWPCVRLFLYPVPVQGEGAAEKIAAGLREVNRRNRQLRLDILIVGRGGGSLEDLWAFNEEAVARAIYDSKIPVISAVGHEIDTTIADLVADKRASTPTKAGVAAVPDMYEVLEQLTHLERRISSQVTWNMELCKENLERILASSVFRNPMLAVHNREQQLDEMESELTGKFKDFLFGIKSRLVHFYEQIIKFEPHRLLGRKAVEVNELAGELNIAINGCISKYQLELASQANRLGALNPRSVLQRGYSISRNKRNGRVVARLEDVEVGDMMVTELAGENLIESEVKKK